MLSYIQMGGQRLPFKEITDCAQKNLDKDDPFGDLIISNLCFDLPQLM